jgi:cyclohexanecarboxyl-CoA dehydrogenase
LNDKVDELPEELHQLRDVAGSVAAQLAPGYVARNKIDTQAAYLEVLKQLGSADLLGLNVPEGYGGQGAGELAAGIVCEEIGYADYSAAMLIIQAGLAAKLLHLYGDPEVAAEWIPRLVAGEITSALALTEPQSGADLRATALRIRRSDDGFVLRGEKSTVSFPDSAAVTVLGRAESGELAMFWVPADTPGIIKSPIEDMGARGQGRCVMTFDDVVVPIRNQLGAGSSSLRAILSGLASSKVLVSLGALGTARAALDDAVAWARERTTFGAPLATRQGIAFPLARHAIEIEMARMLCWRSLRRSDAGSASPKDSAMAKAWVPGHMVEICHTAMLTIGHVAYSDEHPVQLRLRDLMAAEIAEGPENIQLLVVARDLLGVNPT